ncbi:hypothetical protein LTR33_015397, partial [Friedmanniomyces endolithicus]
MAAPYISTPGTERGDATSISHHQLDFSFAQPFASPSKDPGQNLRNHMKGMRSISQPVKTPRARSALVDRRNRQAMKAPEFTPLLKSAQRNQMLQRSILEDKENAGEDGHAMGTPAGFRSSYADQATQLPVNSSMLDAGDTTTSADGRGASTPVPPIASSSTLDSTPLPQFPQRGEGG